MNDRDYASQLRLPTNKFGREIAAKLNRENYLINMATLYALELRSGDSVLEVGMGNGILVKTFFEKENSITYTGCDLSSLMVEEAKLNNRDRLLSGKASFVNADVECMPFRENCFDKIVSVHCIYFWENISNAFGELHRVLKPGGHMAIAVRPRKVMELYPYTKHGFNLYDQEDLVRVLETNQFTVVSVVVKEECSRKIARKEVRMDSLIVIATKYSSFSLAG